ncbi:MAG: chromosome segregation protein SMC [Chitinophagaceae bacterium]|nr:MAG: chromosome segregation protein SMC [Chitinophagaceae bacterium]
MRLKTLEIKGFKSFADKTVLRFDEGVTGVIGPNGCGKSNIIDSIRWVIGEHKISALRSENMSGLIFNGSKSRSASGLAEVSLTFENTRNLLPTEFSTVTVTRKYFKNGESEYRLNDVACRLKDIHNLFLDTGVSTDSYAIIELGMVDDIIKDKDNSRRRMLEQAAGISIYKTRRKEALSKLEATELDINRIEDLLFEINNNLKTLESQARKAERYYEIKKKYREASIELAKASLEGFHQTFNDLNEQLQTEQDKKIQLEAELAKDDAVIEQEKLQFTAKEKALQELQHAFNDLVNQIRTRENDKKLAEQQLTYLQSQKKSSEEFLSGADKKLQQLHEAIASGEKQSQDETETLVSMNEALEKLRTGLEEKKQFYVEKKESLEKVRREYQQWQRSQFESEKKLAVADTSAQNQQHTITQLEQDNANGKLRAESLQKERAELEDELLEQKQELEDLIAHQEETQQKILSAQTDIESLRSRMIEKTRLLDAKKNEHDLLKSLVDNLEGYPDSIKFLKRNNDWSNDALILSDIISCNEEYRPAVEGLLEPYLNYYVVDSLPAALKAVSLLDENKKGKANFFLLDRFDQTLNAPKDSLPEGMLNALDVVETDDKYKGLTDYLLGKVIITENVSGIDDFLLNDPDKIFLEKKGKLYRSQYRIGGGYGGVFEGKKLGRAKNLEKLKTLITGLEVEVGSLNQQIKQRHEEVLGFNNELKERYLSEIREKVNQTQNKIFALQNRMENFKYQADANEKRLAEMRQALEDNRRQSQGVREELEGLTDKMSAIKDAIEVAEKGYQEAEHQYNQENAEFNNHNLQCTRQQSRVQALKQELQFKQTHLSELEAQITSSNAALAKTSEGIRLAEDNIQKIAEELIILFRKRDTDERVLNEKDQEYYNSRNRVNDMESALRLKQRNKEQVEQILNSIKEKTNDLKLQLAGMKERLQVEFKVNLDDILEEERTGGEAVGTLQENAEKMKKRLENMGEINPTAIEAFQEMKKRFDFITDQKNDLTSARDSLKVTISEVETTANQKFLDTFNQVKENFIRVFKTLFTEEDEADMLLSNPEDLAETGVEVIAKPKGKRPTAITQLSGGEKTLTATALLFAIYLIKPAPFCILDEVDAPLDDVNVEKFTHMIRKFSENSQFIIITHNKMTMSAVDVIYGVTMQEAGVSKLVPVDFRSLN